MEHKFFISTQTSRLQARSSDSQEIDIRTIAAKFEMKIKYF